jgi:Uncharacterized protein conserved in bacteria (DUF2237)
MPHYRFPGLVPGDRWCVTAVNWLRAHREGCAALVVLASTHERTLDVMSLEVLGEHAVDVPERVGQPVDGRPRRYIRCMPVDVSGDGDAVVPEQVDHRLDMHTGLQPGHGGAVPQHVNPDTLDPGLGRRYLDVRSTLRGSTGPPSSVVNTRPVIGPKSTCTSAPGSQSATRTVVRRRPNANSVTA